MKIGSIVMKTAGRDAGNRGIIIELDGNTALVDGETRRRKTNLAHLEPTGQSADIKKGASHEDVKKVLDELKITTRTTKPKKAAERPKKVRKVKEAPVEKKATKATKKTAEPNAEKKAAEATPTPAKKSTPKKE